MPRQSSHVTRVCEYCRKEFDFYAIPSKIAKGQGRFCSYACHFEQVKTCRVVFTCEHCGKKFSLRPSEIRKGGGHFCSADCFTEGRKVPLAKRFERYVGPTTEKGCILWIGMKDPKGYGKIWPGFQRIGKGRSLYAHRVAWEFRYGPIPEGLCVLHDCPGGDNPSCINTDHLWLGTHLENLADRDAKGRTLKGTQSFGAKLNDAKVAEIRGRYVAGGITQYELADEYGVSQSIICEVVLRIRWKHVE